MSDCDTTQFCHESIIESIPIPPCSKYVNRFRQAPRSRSYSNPGDNVNKMSESVNFSPNEFFGLERNPHVKASQPSLCRLNATQYKIIDMKWMNKSTEIRHLHLNTVTFNFWDMK
ncbi:hypothetical protein TNIN_380401 [Trichonephila inaurata madagascariensis]|uniref:Uncharacterized protein n=1 Tax=Trichonephila inaurata madagascariensis TaxID=2747483 RepID=A0A8X6X3N2_9ARAC|nr:hypothetical protein TNIN_380401 [Trichonephila inaurata madagascariensis]